jgi:putative transposase
MNWRVLVDKKNVLVRLDLAYQSFFERVKKGETPGFPRFEKRGCWNSITFPQYKNSPEKSKIRVPKLGSVKLSYHREIPKDALIKTLSIVKDAGRWLVCFSAQVLVELEPKRNRLPPVGIDMGLIDFLYTSDGDSVPVPKYLRKKQRQLRRLQRRLANAQKAHP